MSEENATDATTERNRKIKIIQERLKTPMNPEIREKFEGLLAQLQGKKPPVCSQAPLPPIKAQTPGGARPSEGPLETLPCETVKVWTASRYIEVARCKKSKDGVEASQSGEGRAAIDVTEHKVPGSLGPIPETTKNGAAGDANQAVEPGSPTLETSLGRTGEKPERTEGRLPALPATRMEPSQRPAGVPAKTKKQLLTLILGTLWVIASGFLSDDLFHFATFAFPGIAVVGLVYAGLSGQFRRSRLILAAAVAGWVAMALFIGSQDCCISPAQARRYAEYGHPRGLDKKTLTAAEFEIFQLSIPGILLGMVALWWMRKNDAEESQKLE